MRVAPSPMPALFRVVCVASMPCRIETDCESRTWLTRGSGPRPVFNDGQWIIAEVAITLAPLIFRKAT